MEVKMKKLNGYTEVAKASIENGAVEIEEGITPPSGILPKPTVEDAGKSVVVDDNGRYALGEGSGGHTDEEIKALAKEEVESASSGTIQNALGLDSNGDLVKGTISGGTKLYKHILSLVNAGFDDYIYFISNSNSNSNIVNISNILTGYYQQDGTKYNIFVASWYECDGYLDDYVTVIFPDYSDVEIGTHTVTEL